MIRPEAIAALLPWREAAFAVAITLAGFWTAAQGGLLFVPLGVVMALGGAVWVVSAIRRVRFAQAVSAPGMVEVDEAQIAYMGPAFGGFVALPDLIELRLLTIRGRRLWRLKQIDGQALLVPVDAAGAEKLYDAFAALPGMDAGALVAALAPGGAARSKGLAADADTRVIWRRPGAGLARREGG
jgi:hypothetical protein